MRRLVGMLVVLLPVLMFATGCGGGATKAPKNPDKIMEPQEMKMPPDIAKKFGKTTPAPGIPNAGAKK